MTTATIKPKKAKFFIDYKDTEALKRYLNPNGKILPRRITGVSLKKQRRIALAIRRARFMGLLPFVIR